MVRERYCVMPFAMYKANATIPAHVDPFDGTAIAERKIYEGSRGGARSFEDIFPNARPSVDGTMRIIKDNWSDEDLFGLTTIIVMSGFSRKDADGNFQFGTLPYDKAIELMATPEWSNPDEVL